MLPAARLFTADETLRIEKVRYRADVALAFARGKPLQVLLLVKVSVPLRGRLDILDQLPDHRLILQPLAALPDEGHRFAFERRRVLWRRGEERCIISQLVNYYMLPADALPPVEAPAGRTR